MRIEEMIEKPTSVLDGLRDDLALAYALKLFVLKMVDKLRKHNGEDKGERITGWCKEENIHNIHAALCKSLEEGDYISVANYAMFLDNLGYKPGRSSG